MRCQMTTKPVNSVSTGLPQDAVDKIVAALTGLSNDTLDTMTVIVRSNGPALHDFVYTLARNERLMAAKPETWKYVTPRYWKTGEVVTLLCLCSIHNGFKRLTPVMVLERSESERRAVAQSTFWNMIKTKKGDYELLEAALKYLDVNRGI